MLLTEHEVKVKSLHRPLNFYFTSYVYSQSTSGVLFFFLGWKISFPNVEKQFSTRGKYRLLIQEGCALPYPRLSAA